jgi:TonB-dependent starch-binding outer membrane protein SusC
MKKPAALKTCFMFLMGGIFSITVALAQKTISGKVTESKGGAPISGASIIVKGGTAGTSTDADGSFSLTLPADGKVLLISAIGYETKEITIDGADFGAGIKLVTATKDLNEVIVVGYGTRKVKDLTGSVANVTSKDFNKGQIASPEQLIEGRTPGVLVTQSTGEPGAAPTINIRGAGSISGRQEPLYVVDGVPLIQGGTLGSSSGVEGGTTPKNPLIFLNPNDIESMTILKDASAAAIYGSRGANGVILITTKGGRGGSKGSLSFNAGVSIAETAKRYDLLNAQEFLQQAKAANILAGASPADAEAAVKLIDGGASTDWQDQIFRTAVSQNYNLSWGFNRKSTSMRLSGGYDKQEGVVKNSSLKRLTARANITQKMLKDKLKIDAALTYSNTKNQYPPLSNNAGYLGSLLGAALQFNPTNPIKNADGSYYQPGDQRNPVQMLEYFTDDDYINRFLGSITATYNITRNLSYKAVFGYDYSNSVRTSFADPRLGANAYGGTTNIFGRDLQNPIQGNGRTTQQTLDNNSFLTEQYLTYDNTFNQVHSFNAILGYSYQDFSTEYSGKVGWGLTTPVSKPTDAFIKDFGNFKNYADYVPGYDANKLQSVFTRINYSYDDRYFLTGTVRADGSSKFGENNRYATFPAFAFKWKLMNEKFGEKIFGNLFNDVSLRANWGKLGSQDNLGSYSSLNLQQTFDPGTGSQTRFITQGNPDLKWEEVTTTGVGIDLTTKDNRLSLTIDYFNSIRKNMLFLAPTPGGFAPTANWWINLDGEVKNTGWEFGVNWRVIDGNKFTWEVNGNLTMMDNSIQGLPTPINTGAVSGQGLTGAFAQVLTNGQPIYSWSMLNFAGFDGNGFARYTDGAQNVIAGSAVPDFFAGLTNTFTYNKRLSLSVFLNSVRGFNVYNNTANALFLKGSLRNARNVTREVGFGPEHPFNPGSVSTRFLEKGDFIRLSNINLNYNVPVKSGRLVRNLSFFVSGQNLALWTSYSGIDPEVNVDKNINGIPSRGFDYTQYPRPRIVTFGANIGL